MYEGLVVDAPACLNHLPMIAEFLGVDDVDEASFSKVAFLMSRDEMVKHVSAFDDHFITEKGRELGHSLRVTEPVAKMRSVDNRMDGR